MTTPGPDDAGDVRPWEQPGAVRRDCEPHRGPALLLLARVGLGLAVPGRMDPSGRAQAAWARLRAAAAVVVTTMARVLDRDGRKGLMEGVVEPKYADRVLIRRPGRATRAGRSAYSPVRPGRAVEGWKP
jgi:hypothetical protein